ncbi:hypothetical protein V1525DRAFT_351432, partial [Lipomyces kononenkoae]
MFDEVDDSLLFLGKRPPRSQRIDYHLLNDGSDDEAAPEDRIPKRSRSDDAHSTIEPITPDDSASQLSQSEDPLVSGFQDGEFTEDGPSDTSSLCVLEPSGKKPQNQALWAQFTASPLPGKMWWPKRGKGPMEDRQIQCNRCNWKTTDSSRATSTSNMIAHLSKHGIFPNDSQDDQEGITSAKQRPIDSFFQKKAGDNRARLLEQNLVRWVVTANMAFDAIESPEFQRIFQDLTISLP